ncbi:multiheme c-type cytochrome [Rhodopirellula sallentina]|uniref:TPR repeat-containing protein n=1 Tax=Rhodopirellula sallentina SM41 TaxID=1263870 RepID=M5TZ40_9BACT|nr:multiheme c-type cytochrome [Rhodopirellula sallentina]EMI54470.1 TPR repeat-containing protein [Rhodopirellula sallentina SM41]
MRASSIAFLLSGMLLIAGTFAFLRARGDGEETRSDATASTEEHSPPHSNSHAATGVSIDSTANDSTESDSAADIAADDTAPTDPNVSLAKATELPDGIVGTATCAGCHAEQYESYRQTDHSRSLASWSPDSDVPLEDFTHAKSLTVYTAFEEAGQLYHREELEIPATTDDHDPVLFPTGTLPVKYVMGSGAFAHAYLLEDGEYLLQSPMTWYVKPQRYEIAPSYDEPHHSGFTRVVTSRCLYCHAGSLSTPTGNEQKVTIHEQAISCERCHGPGEAHSRLYQNTDGPKGTNAPDIADSMIVHPGNLNRELADAICAQCHLQGDIVVEQPGTSDWDYRPGEPLDSTMVSYKIDNKEESKKSFVDHFDQIWQSKCYTQSGTLTCISCHDPHHKPSKTDIDAVERQYCIQCHQHTECGLPLQERVERENDRCVSCHMPRIDSEVAHAATTHHTIGFHRRSDANADDEPSPEARDATSMVLRRMRSPVEELSADENEARNDFLARAMQLIKLDIREPSENLSDVSLPSSPLRELIQIAKEDPSDIDVLVHIAALARWEAEWLSVNPSETSQRQSTQRWTIAGAYAERVIRVEPSPNENRQKALDVLFDVHYAAERYADAVLVGRELVASKRSEIHQYNLGLAFGKIRRFPEAAQSFQESIRIDGRYLQPYRSLTKLYQAIDPTLANRVRASANAVQANLESK